MPAQHAHAYCSNLLSPLQVVAYSRLSPLVVSGEALGSLAGLQPGGQLLCFLTPCCAVLCCAVPWAAMLRHAVLYCVLPTALLSFSTDFVRVRTGDCLVAFSRRGVHGLQREVARRTGRGACVVGTRMRGILPWCSGLGLGTT